MSKLKRLVVFYTPWNIAKMGYHREPHPATTWEWNQKRFEIWKNTTFQSLLNQTNYNWEQWLKCDMNTLPMLYDIFGDALEDSNYRIRFCAGPSNEHPVKLSLEQHHITDFVQVMKLDSDDMIHRSVVEELLDDALDDLYEEKKTDWKTWQSGYVLNYDTKELRFWQHPGSPQFFAHRYYIHNFYDEPLFHEPVHNEVIKYDPIIGEPGRFIVNVHGLNAAAHMNEPMVRGHVPSGIREQISGDFGIDI